MTFRRIVSDKSDLIRPFVREMVRSSKIISWNQLQEMRLNSYERDYIRPYLDNNALIQLVELYMIHITPLKGGPNAIGSTYDEVLMHKIVPELVHRLKQKKYS